MKDIAKLIQDSLPDNAPQSSTCESDFLDGIQQDGQALALEAVNKLMARAQVYFDCRFGKGTPQAQSALTDFGKVVAECAIANIGLLLRKDYGGYIAAVFGCVVAKLSDGTSPSVDYNPATDARC